MRLNSARTAVALAAPAGVVAGHAVGYLAADPHSGSPAVDHSYLAGAPSLCAPLVVAALLWAATAGAGSCRRSLVAGPLLAAQWALFVGQELVEHTLAGHGPGAALQSPAVWIGVAAQALVAVALALLLRTAAVAGARVTTSLSTLATGLEPPATPARPRSAWRPSFAVTAAPSGRGPPSSLLA